MPTVSKFNRKKKIELVAEFASKTHDINKYPKLTDCSTKVHHMTMRLWAKDDEEIAHIYANAMSSRAEAWLDLAKREIDGLESKMIQKREGWQAEREITTMVNKAKLVIEHARWHASKMCPELYSDYFYEIKECENKIKILQKTVDEIKNK